MKTLILTEKPSVARDFADCLLATKKNDYFENDDFIITYALGHLLTPFDPDDYSKDLKKWSLDTLPIIPTNFRYKPVIKTKKQLNTVVKLLKRPDLNKLIIATDAGREGELIARSIVTFSKVSIKTYRFWTSEALTKPVITTNLQKIRPIEEYDRLYAAGMARQMADWIVGMNFSRVATLKLGDIFSVGRVQTAVLALFSERDDEINKFIPKDYFHLEGEFEFSQDVIRALWIDPTKKEFRNRIFDKVTLIKIKTRCLNKEAIVNKIKTESKKVSSPLLYSLTDLQKDANRRYGFSAKKTLDIAQSLYEKYKCLSYPRTDSKVLGSSSLELAKKIFDKLKVKYAKYFTNYDNVKMSLDNDRIFNDSKLTDHHGLIPLKPFPGDKYCDEFKIYDLVIRRFASAFSRDFTYKDTELYLSVGDDQFFTRGKEVTDLGFRVNDEKEKDTILPKVQKGDMGRTLDVKEKKLTTLPPSFYSDASILQDMVNPSRLVDDIEQKKIFRTEVGLGTQATRASILETLLARKYIYRDGRSLKITKKGRFLIENFKKMSLSLELTRPEKTASWELILERMSKGEKIGRTFINDIINFTKLGVVEWKTTQTGLLPKDLCSLKNKYDSVSLGECPLCRSCVYEGPKSYSCENWKGGCKFTVWKKVSGKPITKTQFNKILKNGSTDLLKGFKSKSGKKFDAKLGLVNEEIRLIFNQY